MARKRGGRGGVNPQEATIPEEEIGDEENESPKKPENESLNDAGEKTSKSKKERRKNGSNRTNKKKKNKVPPTGSTTTTTTTTSKRRRKRNRVTHLANVQEDGNDEVSAISIPLPANHYKTTLYRRALRKRESDSQPSSPSSSRPTSLPEKEGYEDEEKQMPDNNALEEHGDISLGMKLSVVGGRVIVQKLNSLSDGRASPAQMTGVIQRGDVLLSINNLSLVNLPIDLLMERLKPLSTPDANGVYQGVLHLRLAAAEGLELLRKYEAAEKRKAQATQTAEAANEVFSLFPMVDNLSGMPLFDSHMDAPQAKPNHQYQHQEEKKQSDGDVDSPESGKTYATKISEETQEHQHQHKSLDGQQARQQHPTAITTTQSASMDQKSLNDVISSDLAFWRAFDRDKFVSEFFAWNDKYSELLRPSAGFVAAVKEMTSKGTPMTRPEMIELGLKAMRGAELLSRNMEAIDRGRDNRSFRSWNSSISLRSGASTRRRYVLDAVSLPVRWDQKSAAASTPPRQGSPAVTDEDSENEQDDVDGDALLLRLAAHDEIWRSQVIEALEKARDELNKEEESEELENNEPSAKANGNMDTAMTEGLGAFLFGEAMSKIVTKKKKSKALPPEEITAVLFDLSTNLASSMPDEITLSTGTNTGPLKSSLIPFESRKKPEAGSSIILATRFVLDEALVVWLETFIPLPWASRRVLWAHVRRSPTASDEGRSTSFSDGDSLTVESPKSTHTSTANGTGNHRRKDLQQQIEDQELDVETRAETCFLVTYYFTQRLLPKLATFRNGNSVVDEAGAWAATRDQAGIEDLVAFVRKYGAYMTLHTSLAYAAALKCKDVIDELLELAEHDLRHREVVRLFAKRNALVLYEPTMLSAIVKCLPLIRKEPNKERRQMLVDVCVSAYPDLCPWQVKGALLESSEEDASISKGLEKELNDLYYYYLSSLLHPRDGHEAARNDRSLVKEWCILSLDAKSDEQTKKDNFFCVASRNSSNHLAYSRDLVMLLKLGMDYHEYDLALDLVGELLDHPRHTQNKSSLSLSLQCLRDIAHHVLDKDIQNGQHAVLHTLKRVVRLFHHMASNSSERAQQCIDVSDELHSLLRYKEDCSGVTSRDILDLIHFFAKETPPGDFLRAFTEWTSSHEILSDTIHVLQTVLRRGARLALNTELSGSLLRLKRARQHINATAAHMPYSDKDEPVQSQSLWSLMSKGQVMIDK